MKYQTFTVALALLVLLAAIWLFIVAQPLVDSLVIAGLLAYLLDPLVRKLEHYFHLRRSLAATLLYLLLVVIVVGLVAALGAVVWEQVPRLNQELHDALDEMRHWLERPIVLFGFSFYPEALLEDFERSFANAMSTLPAGSTNILAEITQNLLWALVVVVSLYYFLKDGPRLKPWLVSLMPAAYQLEGQRLLNEIDTVWGVFLRMQLLIFAILAGLFLASTTLIIWLFRIGWLPLSPIGLVILLVAVYAAIQQVDNLWLRPQLLGRTLQLHPGVVFVSLIAALALSGLLGAIIVVPVLATLKVIGRYVHARLLGLPPWSDLPDQESVMLVENQPGDDENSGIPRFERAGSSIPIRIKRGSPE